MTRKSPFIAGNWKMHTDRDGARKLAADLGAQLGRVENAEVGLFPPFPFLTDVAEIAAAHGYSVGGQNLYAEPKGAFTGEVSGPMLTSAGCRYVILGHSERRHILGETDEVVAKKVRAALDAGLDPILCVGEKQEERESGRTDEVISGQTEAVIATLSADDFARLTLAYEPVWAIGTGLTATPDQAREAHATLRARLEARFGADAAKACRILYGGSVKPGNAAELMGQDEIQGALVGGASLEAESFAAIVRGALDGVGTA